MYCKKTALILASVGAINWGLIGVADFNLVDYIFGNLPVLERVIYSLIGVAGIYGLYRCCGCCGTCKTK